jgi:Legionella pneumophila major outer membrane protein precursor
MFRAEHLSPSSHALLRCVQSDVPRGTFQRALTGAPWGRYVAIGSLDLEEKGDAMTRFARYSLAAALLGLFGLTGRSAAQTTLPPAPVIVVPPAPPGPGPIIARPGAPIVTPPVAVPPPPPPGFQPAPLPPPVAPVAPVVPVYGPEQPNPFFVSVDLAVLFPTMSIKLKNEIPVAGGTDTINVPGVGLDTTLSPRIEFGYRLPDTQGQFSFAYRFISTQGTGTSETDLGTDTNLRSRLDLNQLDFDYATARYSPEPRWDIQWRLGARAVGVFSDTSETKGAFEKSASNYFVGAGPHLGFEVEHRSNILPAFGFFANVDGAVLIGQDEQKFHLEEPGFSTLLEAPRKTLTVPTVSAQAGISYTPPGANWLHFRAGYQFEHWFDLGNVGQSRLDMSAHGPFLHGQIDF